MSPLNEAGYFLFNVIFDLITWLFLLRLLLQLVRADFYNPLSQFIVKTTAPILTPLRRLIPPVRQLDTASLVVLVLLGMAKFALTLYMANGILGHPLGLLVLSLGNLLSVTLTFYVVLIFILALLSWVAPYQHNPGISLLGQLTAPVLRPAQRIIPSLSGLDLSPLVTILALQLLQILIAKPIMQIGQTML